jgi:hypothetical protein
MAIKRHKPEEIVAKLRQVSCWQLRNTAPMERAATGSRDT